MGKRSDFERIPRDFYPTPREAVVPLVPHLPSLCSYWEPCAGDGALIKAINEQTRGDVECVACSDIEPRGLTSWMQKVDALKAGAVAVEFVGADYIITNPPWDRKILHPMIEHFSAMRPTWLLFDADWMHTKQSAPFMPWLRKVVSVGRVKWIPDSKYTGKDNCCWYLFDQHAEGPTEFVGRAA
ncbi:class I SAM-dependent methyltransferase [Ruegeria sp. HKCCA4812]|uniref:class I SAM-dependent methyltransferase n=1 Tax=Ruegeria sp. HKCCA4812 TaxID=2682993 RepID=UPI001487D303|nr:class I SAM-dependent methyltransferase [Ruegeria sp. HKCCA4812]